MMNEHGKLRESNLPLAIFLTDERGVIANHFPHK